MVSKLGDKGLCLIWESFILNIYYDVPYNNIPADREFSVRHWQCTWFSSELQMNGGAVMLVQVLSAIHNITTLLFGIFVPLFFLGWNPDAKISWLYFCCFADRDRYILLIFWYSGKHLPISLILWSYIFLWSYSWLFITSIL